MNKLLRARNDAIRNLAHPLPGAIAYDNVRPINVPGRFEAWTLYEVMCELHPRISRDEWARIFDLGRIRKRDVVVPKDTAVRGGEQFLHVFPDTIEPDVNPSIRVIHEDDDLVVVNKPAPLPMHPSGRFNRNTMISILNTVYAPRRLLIAHRLDANTTGVVVLSKNSAAAQNLQDQFEDSGVSKEYMVRCQGHPDEDHFDCRQPIGKHRGHAGMRTIQDGGLPSLTRFKVLQRLPDQTSILNAQPVTGRTNQIRVHLWNVGMPVVGDPLYLPLQQLGSIQTLQLDAVPMCLHAFQLEMTHPTTGDKITFQAPYPDWVPESVECG